MKNIALVAILATCSLCQAQSKGAGNDDTELIMHQVVSEPSRNSDIIVVGVHGIMGNYSSMTKLVSIVASELGCRNGFSLAYEWQDAMNNGSIEYLASWLAKRPRKKVLLIGDSFGCLVARQALKNHDAQEAVQPVWLVAGPNEGSIWANPGKTFYELTSKWLDAAFKGVAPYKICPSINAMVPGSRFLRELNTAPDGELPNIDYYLFAADLGLNVGDHVVGVDSALCRGINLAAFTRGQVYRETITGESHESVFRNPSSIKRMVKFYKNHRSAGSLAVSASGRDGSAGPIEADAGQGCWYWRITVTNTTNQVVTLEDLSMTTRKQDRSFDDCVWYDPTLASGTLFPRRYASWGVSLQPGESTTVEIQNWADNSMTPVWEQASQLNHAFTMIPIIRYHLIDGKAYSQPSNRLVFHHGPTLPVPTLSGEID